MHISGASAANTTASQNAQTSSVQQTKGSDPISSASAANTTASQNTQTSSVQQTKVSAPIGGPSAGGGGEEGSGDAVGAADEPEGGRGGKINVTA